MRLADSPNQDSGCSASVLPAPLSVNSLSLLFSGFTGVSGCMPAERPRTNGGGSSGAITSVGGSVTDPGDFRDELSELEDPTILTTHLDQDYALRTILDFWGSRTSVDLLQGGYDVERFDSNNPPLFISHGTADSTVIFSNALLLQDT